ncbi:MAG: methionine synthase [Rikenellaceae bacterium]
MIKNDLKERILILDGALGTMIQTYQLNESDFRDNRFSDSNIELKGCNDILSITAPNIILDIHARYLEAGADIITTNSFNANSISLAEYQLQDFVYEINFAAAQLARQAIGELKGRYVAGSVGPTGRSASMSPKVESPALRNITFEQLEEAYTLQISALINGGVDLILLETVFDTLNCKAAIAAHERICNEKKIDIPLMISGTISDSSGRILSGQTVEAFVESVSHSKQLLSLGLNCAFGAELIYPYLQRLERTTSHYVSVHPNAGLPDAFGRYSHTPKIMAEIVEKFMQDKTVNIVGGCCGTTPSHIKALKEISKRYTPRTTRKHEPISTFSGLEPLKLTSDLGFINIGERANVAGSAKFARLIREEKFDEALAIVTKQVAAGVSVIDVCMDDAMIDGKTVMRHFLNLMASEPEIARLPVMIDSSKWEVIEYGLRTQQGKPIVNSISLKEGEQEFLHRADIIQRYGAAAVVMLFDENGQADSYQRKIEVACRAYRLLTNNGFKPENIIFDPNVLTIGTGIAEHAKYGIDFIKAVEYIKLNLPYAKVSAGVSNLSFAFRGNNPLREAMHSAFLYHAIKAGLDMAIVNGTNMMIYEDINPELLTAIEDLILNRNDEATEKLLEISEKMLSLKSSTTPAKNDTQQWRKLPINERLGLSISKGITQYINDDTLEALAEYRSAVNVIEQPLMEAMKHVGTLFSEGKMFLPQVVKSARVMKMAVDALQPYIKTSNDDSKLHKIVVATVKGDVHDIGKNIVSIVLSCNGFEVIDLGVMVPAQNIVDAVREHKPTMAMLSGLITPSLDEMAYLLKTFEKEKISLPVLVGGATTSKLHTTVKLQPLYSGLTWQTSDASSCAQLALELVGSHSKQIIKTIKYEQNQILNEFNNKSSILSITDARSNKFIVNKESIVQPQQKGTFIKELKFETVCQLINWTSFFAAWQVKGQTPQLFDHPQKGEEARNLYNDALEMLKIMSSKVTIKAQTTICDATTKNETIIITDKSLELNVGRDLQQGKKLNLSLADFLHENGDYVGFINVSVFGIDQIACNYEGDHYSTLMLKLLADRLAEASSEYLHYELRTSLWGYSNEEFNPTQILKGKWQGIRPAFGYPCLKDHKLKRKIFDALNIEKNIGTTLTENYSMLPQSSISAMIFANQAAKYFIITD